MTHDKRLAALEVKHPELNHVIHHPIGRALAEREGLDPDRVSDSDCSRLGMAGQFCYQQEFSPELQEAAKKYEAESEARVLQMLAEYPEGTTIVDILVWERDGILDQHRISETVNAD